MIKVLLNGLNTRLIYTQAEHQNSLKKFWNEEVSSLVPLIL